MGLLTELFIATDAEARSSVGGAPPHAESAQLGGLTNLEFETLWAILLDEEWSPERHSLAQVAGADSWWTFRFPDAYVAALLRLEANESTAAASAWAETDEISATPSDVLPIISTLRRLAMLVAPGQGLFLWTSL